MMNRSSPRLRLTEDEDGGVRSERQIERLAKAAAGSFWEALPRTIRVSRAVRSRAFFNFDSYVDISQSPPRQR